MKKEMGFTSVIFPVGIFTVSTGCYYLVCAMGKMRVIKKIVIKDIFAVSPVKWIKKEYPFVVKLRCSTF